MNILIQFEDTFGCFTLFNEVAKNKGLFADKSIYFDIYNGKSNTAVFHIGKSKIRKYDYAIIVFDMNDNIDVSLTSEGILEQLRFNIIRDDISNTIKNEYANKIVLIPVFFCFETMYLYSDILVNIINNLNANDKSKSRELLEVYSKYYDYSTLNPESIYNAEENLPKIRAQCNLSMQGDYLPQNFQLSYAKQLLRIYLKDDLYNEKYINNNDKVYEYLEKKEDRLFKFLEDYNKKSDILDSILHGLNKYAIHNYRFFKFLNLATITDLHDMILTQQSLTELCDELDGYNKSIRGKNKDICDILDKPTLESNYAYNEIEE